MLRFGSRLYQFGHPTIMGILNVTPDSFAVHCSRLEADEILAYADALLHAGADILDVGACSTRPNAEWVSADEEWHRLDYSLSLIRENYPDAILSLDTFRASIAQQALEKYRVDMINDVSGMSDSAMAGVVARARVPYILTYPDGDAAACLPFFAHRLDELHRAGVADVILDPGFGFGKTLEQNYAMLHALSLLRCLKAPILVGLSRKSMLYQPLGITPSEALNATTAAHVLALLNGANILRVHDVAEAVETAHIVQLYQTYNG